MNNNPYRLLSSFTYDSAECPLSVVEEGEARGQDKVEERRQLEKRTEENEEAERTEENEGERRGKDEEGERRGQDEEGERRGQHEEGEEELSQSILEESEHYIRPPPPSQVRLLNDFKNISDIKGHDVFLRMLINAKKLADMKNTPVPVTWRGYKTLVHPELPNFNRSSLIRRLCLALKGIRSTTNEELQV